jgi:hypothetical protein
LANAQTPKTPASEPVAVEETVSSPPEAAPATPVAAAPKRTDVGNKRPPKEYQFKPGVSGNPRGRPKGSRSLSTLVDEALSKTINVRIGGRSVRMSHREVMVKRYVEQAMKGDHKAFTVLLKLDPKARVEAVEDEAPAALSDDEQALFLSFLKNQEEDAQ